MKIKILIFFIVYSALLAAGLSIINMYLLNWLRIIISSIYGVVIGVMSAITFNKLIINQYNEDMFNAYHAGLMNGLYNKSHDDNKTFNPKYTYRQFDDTDDAEN